MESNARQGTTGKKVGSRANCYRADPSASVRPLRALFQHLNQPSPSAYGRQRIADHAATSMRVIQLGMAAIGHLLAHSAVQVEEQGIPSEAVESLGRLMAELGELAALCHQLCTEGVDVPERVKVQEGTK
jgi:hypothetical protein